MDDGLDRGRAWRPRVRMVARFVVAIAVVALVVWLVLVPQFESGRRDIVRLLGVSPVLVTVAAAFEVLSLLCFSLLTRLVLGRVVPYRRLLAIDLADLAVNHTLPGGGATAAAFRYRLLRADGVASRRAITVAAVETALSNLALGAVFLVGVGVSLGRVPFSAALWGAVAGVLVLSALVALVVWLLLARVPFLLGVARATERRMPFLRSRLVGLTGEAAQVVATVVRDRSRSAIAAAAAVGNWLLDAAALVVVLGAFGAWVDPATLLTAYGLSMLLAQLPITPGGIGIVEGTATLILTGAGVGHATALLGVVGWRVLEFWLPVPIGWVCYLVLRTRPLASSDGVDHDGVSTHIEEARSEQTPEHEPRGHGQRRTR